MKNLQEHKSRLLLQPLNMSGVKLSEVIKGRQQWSQWYPTVGAPKEAQPEEDALWFYLTNHAVAIVTMGVDPHEPLDEDAQWVLNDYHDRMQVMAMRAFYYLLQICTRESRHAINGCPAKTAEKFPTAAKLYSCYGKTGSSGESGALAAIDNAHQWTPDLTIGEWSAFLSAIFYEASYHGGYGGKKWGVVADVLKQFVWGEITGEMMMDTVWTLCHNNGPIFNKGMWYKHYGSQQTVLEILDVQRAGMIPAYVWDAKVRHKSYASAGYVTKAMVDYCKKLQSLSPVFTAEVDWSALKSLGAVGNYSSFQKAYPVSAGNTGGAAATSGNAKVVEWKKKMAKKKADAHAAWVKANSVEVMPNVVVTKFTPTRTAAPAEPATATA